MNEALKAGGLASTGSVKAGKIGVLLVNLGTPDDTSYWPMRRYLKEFLSDRRVIETNRVLWWLILNGVVLVRRPFASGEKYRSIWNEEKNESPLRTITRSQAEKVAAAFASQHQIVIDWAMRYGSPSIALAHRSACCNKAATGCWCFRSIRNIRPRPRRRSTTRPSRRCSRCARSRRFAPCRLIPTIRSISRRWRNRSALTSRASTSSPR